MCWFCGRIGSRECPQASSRVSVPRASVKTEFELRDCPLQCLDNLRSSQLCVSCTSAEKLMRQDAAPAFQHRRQCEILFIRLPDGPGRKLAGGYQTCGTTAPSFQDRRNVMFRSSSSVITSIITTGVPHIHEDYRSVRACAWLPQIGSRPSAAYVPRCLPLSRACALAGSCRHPGAAARHAGQSAEHASDRSSRTHT